MFSYISNIFQDIYYGYIEIKCANPNCSRIFKMSRNKLDIHYDINYSCNIGCALNSFNEINKVNKIINEDENINEFIV